MSPRATVSQLGSPMTCWDLNAANQSVSQDHNVSKYVSKVRFIILKAIVFA